MSTPSSGENAVASGLPRSDGGALQRLASRLLGSGVFWAAFVLLAFVAPILRAIGQKLPPPLPILGTVGEFELVDQIGRPYGTNELKGKTWLASAMRTDTKDEAGQLATDLGKVQRRVVNLGEAFHLVTMGIDPEVDTPSRLVEFASHRAVSPRMWSFLSGDRADLERAQSALGIAKGDQREAPRRLLLIDGKLRIRGRYDLSDPSAINTLLYDTGLLVNRGD